MLFTGARIKEINMPTKINFKEILATSQNYDHYKSNMSELFNQKLIEFLADVLGKPAQEIQDETVIREATTAYAQLTVRDIKQKFDNYKSVDTNISQITDVVNNETKVYQNFNKFLIHVVGDKKKSPKKRVGVHNVAKNFIKTQSIFAESKKEAIQALAIRKRSQSKNLEPKQSANVAATPNIDNTEQQRAYLKELNPLYISRFNNNKAVEISKNYEEYKQIFYAEFTKRLYYYLCSVSYAKKQNKNKPLIKLKLNQMNDDSIVIAAASGQKEITVKNFIHAFNTYKQKLQDEKQQIQDGQKKIIFSKYCMDTLGNKSLAGNRKKLNDMASMWLTKDQYEQQYKKQFVYRHIQTKVIDTNEIQNSVDKTIETINTKISSNIKDNVKDIKNNLREELYRIIINTFDFQDKKLQDSLHKELDLLITQYTPPGTTVENLNIQNMLAHMRATILQGVTQNEIQIVEQHLEKTVEHQVNDLKPRSLETTPQCKQYPIKTRDNFYLNSEVVYQNYMPINKYLRTDFKYMMPPETIKETWLQSKKCAKMAKETIVIYHQLLDKIKVPDYSNKDSIMPTQDLIDRLYTCKIFKHLGDTTVYRTKKSIGYEEGALQYTTMAAGPTVFNTDIDQQIGFDERHAIHNTSMNLDFQIKNELHEFLCTAGNTRKVGKIDGNIYEQLIYHLAKKKFIPSKQEILNPLNKYVLIDGEKTDQQILENGETIQTKSSYLKKLMTMPKKSLMNTFIKGVGDNYLSCEMYYKIKQMQILQQIVSSEYIAKNINKEYGDKYGDQSYHLNTLAPHFFSGRFEYISILILPRIMQDLLETYANKFEHFSAWCPYSVYKNFGIPFSELNAYFKKSSNQYNYKTIVCDGISFLSPKQPDYTKGQGINIYNAAEDPLSFNNIFESGTASTETKIANADSSTSTLNAPSHAYNKYLITLPKSYPKKLGNDNLLKLENRYLLTKDENHVIKLTNVKSQEVALTIKPAHLATTPQMQLHNQSYQEKYADQELYATLKQDKELKLTP